MLCPPCLLLSAITGYTRGTTTILTLTSGKTAMPAISKQTPADSVFFYNPLAGCNIYLFPRDRSLRDPRIFILQPVHPFDADADFSAPKSVDPITHETKYFRLKQATACNGRVIVSRDSCGNTICTVNGKSTERYTIVPPKTRKRTCKPFAVN